MRDLFCREFRSRRLDHYQKRKAQSGFYHEVQIAQPLEDIRHDSETRPIHNRHGSWNDCISLRATVALLIWDIFPRYLARCNAASPAPCLRLLDIGMARLVAPFLGGLFRETQ